MLKTDLPIQQVLQGICSTLASKHELVLEAPPGAGKTTIVPLALLHEPWLQGKKIIMLEPRRMAARAAAQRMAGLLGEPVGKTVGYRVRLENSVSAATRIEVITEGILTRMLQSDPSLAQVALLIFDEFHERNLDSDLGLALALQGRELFREADNPLRLLVMSATLDGAAVATLLQDAPVLTCAGRQFPVQVHYSQPRQLRNSIIEPLAAQLRTLMAQEETGSVLVFLPGQGEIRRLMQALPRFEQVQVCPLYGGLSLAEQQRAIEPAAAGSRKLVLATNIAETSLTIEGVNTVVDSGLARQPVYDPGTGMTRLQLRRVSRSSSIQRMGRAGRLGPGQCYRLWSEQQQQQLAPNTTPEIMQADLTPLALQLLAWGVNDPAELQWLDAPPAGPYSRALALLEKFGAAHLTATGNWQLTERGEQMARLPLHPRLAYMLLAGRRWGLAEMACQLAALFSERDPLAGSGVDISRRLALINGQSACPKAQRDWLKRVQRQAQNYARASGEFSNNSRLEKLSRHESVGILLASAWPDRIALRRPGLEGIYQLSNGRTAVLASGDELCGSEWLAVAELGGRVGESEDRIYLAAELAPSLFEEQLADLVDSRDVAEWDTRDERFIAERRDMVGALVLSRERLQDIPLPAKRQALQNLIKRRGLGLLPWTDELRQWQARVLLLRELEGDSWPDVSDVRLLQDLDQWLGGWLDDVNKLEHFQRLDLSSILKALLPWPLAQKLDELAPAQLPVPSGSVYRIDYACSPPVLAVKLQEMFGCEQTPSVARGKVKLLLHLLSPAGRPLQVTQDLAGFWRGSYQQVKKEMKGRYPKHPWPDDPLQAQATRHTSRRQARES